MSLGAASSYIYLVSRASVIKQCPFSALVDIDCCVSKNSMQSWFLVTEFIMKFLIRLALLLDGSMPGLMMQFALVSARGGKGELGCC